MKIEAMELVGVVVNDLDSAVAKYGSLFGVEFRTFLAGVDYQLTDESAAPDASAQAPPDNVRIAMDTTGLFELIEIPGARQGFRNIHFRVKALEASPQTKQMLG